MPAIRWFFLLLAFTHAGGGQTIEALLPSGGSHSASLAPGMLMSIYGSQLGPDTACTAQADTTRRETPSPLRPHQTFAETLIYPKRLCGVEVLVGGVPAGLLYVHSRQINFKVPQETPLQGTAEVRVLREGKPGPAVTMKLGLEFAVVTLDEPAFTNMPVWIRVSMPYGWQQNLQYPFGIAPGDFACHAVEVRRNGVLLPRLLPGPPQPGGLFSGSFCGFLGLPEPAARRDRLPLHLQYRFEEPGTYEVRYILNPARPSILSVWTPIQVHRGTPEQRAAWLRRKAAQVPPNAADLIADFLPSVLGVPDSASLELVAGCLHHPDNLVRRFAAAGLRYWAEDQVRTVMLDLVRRRGPSDVAAEFLTANPERRQDAQLVSATIPFLSSDSPVQLRGAVTMLSRIVSDPQKQTDPALQARAERAMLDAAEHIVGTADSQTLVDYTAALGQMKDARSHELLWDFIKRRIALSQAVVAVTWRRDRRDLPRLGALLKTPAGSSPLQHDLASLPYALHRAYGPAAIPYLEDAAIDSEYVWVRTGCARELVLAGHATGFAFIADALENNRPYKLELVQFLRDRFPELRGVNEAAVLAFARSRAEDLRPGLLF